MFQLAAAAGANFNRERDNAVEEAGTGYSYPLPARSSNAGLGWTLSLGMLIPPGTMPGDPPIWTYVSPDGAQHSFYDLLHGGAVYEEDGSDATGYTRDSSYTRMTLLPDETRILEMADDTIHRFSDHGTAGAPDWRRAATSTSHTRTRPRRPMTEMTS